MLPTTDEPDRLPSAPHPRETLALIGHEAQERRFSRALASGRMHHGWLLGGPRESARRASPIAPRASSSPRVTRRPRRGRDFARHARDRPRRRAGSWRSPIPICICCGASEAGRQELHQQHSGRCRPPRARPLRRQCGGRRLRVCIVDSAEDMTARGQRPAEAARGAAAARAVPDRRPCAGTDAADDPLALPADDLRRAGAGSGGAGWRDGAGADGRALRRLRHPSRRPSRRRLGATRPDLCRSETLALVEAVRARLDALPRLDLTALMALAEDVAGKAGEGDFAIMVETFQSWLSDHLHAHAAAQPARLAPLAEVWTKAGGSGP